MDGCWDLARTGIRSLDRLSRSEWIDYTVSKGIMIVNYEIGRRTEKNRLWSLDFGKPRKTWVRISFFGADFDPGIFGRNAKYLMWHSVNGKVTVNDEMGGMWKKLRGPSWEQGHTKFFLETCEPHENCRRRKGDMNQYPFWGPANVMHQRMIFRRLGNLASQICASLA